MSRIPPGALAAACLALLALPARAFLGVADTSFVTVIANPAEAANWAEQIQRLSDQLAAARNALQVVTDLRAYAGDPAAAARASEALQEVAGALSGLTSGPQTAADLERAWTQLGAAERSAQAALLLARAGQAPTLDVFGQQQPRDMAAFGGLARDSAVTGALRSQVSAEQAARATIGAKMEAAWAGFRAAATESSKQAALTEISELQAEDQVLGARRQALVDDLGLSDRQAAREDAARSRSTDQQLLAESALLGADLASRASGAEAQRVATLGRQAPQPGPRDYSGMQLWSTADALGQP
ncbi:MAG TPA: hypothetical protein VGG34_10915 [Opitutaceae bacterium]|jgi:hypothetical protein